MSNDFQVTGNNPHALFSLKIHRGDGMALLAMNWKTGKPPRDFAGFAIEYQEPGGEKFFVLKNRLAFPGAGGSVNPNKMSTLLSPIQKFRWVHFPRNAELAGDFIYRVTPAFMDNSGVLSYGNAQEAAIQLHRETFPGILNVTFSRGFVSSQAFVDRYVTKTDGIRTLLPAKADEGLDFVPSHPEAKKALTWMGFEARSAILEVLDLAIADTTCKVAVVAYDLSENEIVARLKKLGKRLRIVIDDSKEHGEPTSAETEAARRLSATAGKANVKRHHMNSLQHNKTIVVTGPKLNTVVCGSTNYSWRGFFVQSNNAVILQGESAAKPFLAAFEEYLKFDGVADFAKTNSAKWSKLGLSGIKAEVAFSPHSASNALLKSIAADVESAKSSVFYSLAFLSITPGPVSEAIDKVTKDKSIFVYGIADKRVSGLQLMSPDGNASQVFAAAISGNLPEPFKSEPTGGGGTRMHHKFVVLDFNTKDARVYLGSYNFSSPADIKNGENLLLIRDRRIATSYMIEALRIFDHYQFRVAQADAKTARTKLTLAPPPTKPGEKPWFDKDYTIAHRIRDRELFA